LELLDNFRDSLPDNEYISLNRILVRNILIIWMRIGIEQTMFMFSDKKTIRKGKKRQ
jgi:hypothetical protein